MRETEYNYISQEIHETPKPIIDWDDMLETNSWATAQGRIIRITDMKTDHIKNVLRCIRGESKTRIPHNWSGKNHKEWIKLFEEELLNRS